MTNKCVWFKVAMTFLIIGAVSTAKAAERTWNGAVDSDYATGGNWVGGTAPVNGDWTDQAKFTENSPANKTPNLGANRAVRSITFDNSVGWTFTGSQITLRYVDSSGSGTNSIRNVKTYSGSNATWTIGEGNTLVLVSAFYIDQTRTINLKGGGTLLSKVYIDGWSSERRLKIINGTLRVEKNSAFQSSGAAIIASEDAVLELKTDVSSAENLIGSRILDDTDLGLIVTDIGGGYVSITTAPPKVPGTVLIIE